MKANELMIGDWVTNKTLTHFEKIDEDFFVGILTRKYEISEILPILLTPEILEKNGFIYEYRPEPYLSIYERDGIMLTKAVCDAFPRLRIGRKWTILQYVHELQHILRLCGLTELADNFQLPELLKEGTK